TSPIPDPAQQLDVIGMDHLIRTRKLRCHLWCGRLLSSMAPYNLTIMSTCTGTLPTFAGLGLLFVTAGIVDRFTRACTLALTVLGTPAATASTRLASTMLTATATTTLTVGATKAFGLFGVESFAGSLRFRQTTLGILGDVQVLIQVWGRRIGFNWLDLFNS